MSRISKDKSDKSTITSNEIMSCHASDYEKNGTVTFFSKGVIRVDDNSSLCEGLTKSETTTIEYLKNLEKENTELKLKLEEAREENHKLKKIVEDFDESVRYLMTVAPQLDNILKNMRRSYREDLYKLIENELKEQGEWVT